MATRAAARPLRRHVNARVRAAALPASYTTTWDTTEVAQKLALAGRRSTGLNGCVEEKNASSEEACQLWTAF